MFKVSKGNSKLGAIYNINLPAMVTCAKGVPCSKYCYARKGNYGFSNVKACYAENLRTFMESPEQAENDILLQLPHVDSDYFTLHCRLHSSGDFPNAEYFEMIVRIAEKRPYMKFLAFTKQYEIVNTYLDNNYFIPNNLQIVFSHWKGYEMDNRHNFPVAIVEEFNELQVTEQAFSCEGKCELCFKCWNMEREEQVIFKRH